MTASRVSVERLCRAVIAASRLGVLSAELLVAALRVPLEEARLLLAALLAAGWAEPIRGETGCPCSRCPLARVCPFARHGGERRSTQLYRVRREAVERCRKLLEGGDGLAGGQKQPVERHGEAHG